MQALWSYRALESLTFQKFSSVDTLLAIRETWVSRHRGLNKKIIKKSASWGPNWGPPWPETPCASQHFFIGRFKGGPWLVPHYAERRQSLGQPMWVFPVYFFFFFQKIILSEINKENFFFFFPSSCWHHSWESWSLSVFFSFLIFFLAVVRIIRGNTDICVFFIFYIFFLAVVDIIHGNPDLCVHLLRGWLLPPLREAGAEVELRSVHLLLRSVYCVFNNR